MPQTEPATPTLSGPNPGTTYWRSLEELQFTPQFEEYLHREFPQAASEFPAGMSRRRWLQLMGASLTLAGVTGCRWQTEEFLPAATRVPDYIPGEPQFLATLHELRGFARSLLVRQFDGRPIKIEGNPEHPQSHGATDVFAQACILDLYDPDRMGGPIEFEEKKANGRTWQQVQDSIASLAGKAGDGAGLRVLAGASSSPTRLRLERALAERFPQAKWVEYEPISRQSVEQGAQQAFGQRLRPHYKFDAADVILVIDGDPFGSDPDQINHARGWAARRTPEDGPMNRMYVVESQYGSTGVAADHREPIASSRIPQFLDALETAIGEADGGEAKSDNVFIRALASDLVASKGKGLIYVGPRQPAAVHARVHRLNGRLQNLGATVVFTEETNPERAPYAEAIAALADEMRSGNVDTLLILKGNPVYDAPADVEFAAALQKVPNAIHVGEYRNETTRSCRWYLPATHALEQWGDGRSYDGMYTLQQPLIAPLHGSRSECEILTMLLEDGPQTGDAIVRQTFQEIAGGDDENTWRQALHDGYFAEAMPSQPVEASPQEAGDGERQSQPTLGDGDFEVVFCESEHVYDGRFANNGWLQEAPAFLSKLTWDNAAILSYNDAAKLGVAFQDVVRVTVGEQSIELPVYVLPGQADGSVGIELGYGRTAAGLVGGFEDEHDERRAPVVGVDAYVLRTTKMMSVAPGAKIEKVEGRTWPLATTQDHFAIDAIGRQEINERVPTLVREYTQDIYESKSEENPGFVREAVHHPPLESLWVSPDYSKDHAWGMAIDLSKCIGCNACVVACQSENNVPVVGKQQVLAGREMHWLRIDRYFRGRPEGRSETAGGVGIVGQPVLCMHCEHAPCEQVCPVAAAVHDHEGLNLMVYNRCVGTRYCNNNCPYKVRRFNFFNWNRESERNKKYRTLPVLGLHGEKELEDKSQTLASLVFNPEVTVRSRGVMEKCTYCQQRIAAAKIEARNHNVHSDDPAVRRSLKVQDGAVETACQQTCPTDAIVFGDLGDTTSRVYKLHHMRSEGDKTPPHSRSYGMLSELNVRPRTAYLARIKNPHKLLAELEAYAIPPLGHAGGHHDSHSGDDSHDESHDEHASHGHSHAAEHHHS